MVMKEKFSPLDMSAQIARIVSLVQVVSKLLTRDKIGGDCVRPIMVAIAPCANDLRHCLALYSCLVGLSCEVVASDWPQYRGPNTDGTSPDLISTNWPVNGPTVVWTNMSLTNGFSTFAVSQGRAFVLISKRDGGGNLLEYCVAVDAATGTNIWETSIGAELWDPGADGYGGAGK